MRLCILSASLALVATAAFAQTATPPAPAKAGAKTLAKASAKPSPNAFVPPSTQPGLYVQIATSQGNIVGRLFEKESPVTVKNFQDLAMGRKPWTDPATGQRSRKPLYNGLIFHRVIPGFMIQGGDPTGTGSGGTDVIPDEFDRTLGFDRPGIFGMANAGPNTGSSQFFITDAATPHLTGRHTIFGEVVEGTDIVSKIANVPRNPEDRPNTPVKMLRVSFARVADPNAQSAAPAKPTAAKPTATKPTAAKPTAAKPTAAKPKAAKPKAAQPKATEAKP